MAHYHVPGVSIALIDSGRVAWARGFGVGQAGTTDSVNDSTIFQAGSVSKPIAVTGMAFSLSVILARALTSATSAPTPLAAT